MATIEERLYEIIAESLSVSVEDIKPDSSFIDDLDADSLDVVEMIMAMESEFSSDENDLEISDEESLISPNEDSLNQLSKFTLNINMENKSKIIESAEELKKGLDLLSRERKVVMPHNKAFDHVDRLKEKIDEIINLAETG